MEYYDWRLNPRTNVLYRIPKGKAEYYFQGEWYLSDSDGQDLVTITQRDADKYIRTYGPKDV